MALGHVLWAALNRQRSFLSGIWCALSKTEGAGGLFGGRPGHGMKVVVDKPLRVFSNC